MAPWLVLVIAVLVVVCALLFFQTKQVESAAHARQSLLAEELQEAEATLSAALEQLQQLEEVRWDGGAGEARSVWKTSSDPTPRTSQSAPRSGTAPDWRVRAMELAAGGVTPRQIAREMELPVGEVEFLLSLGLRR